MRRSRRRRPWQERLPENISQPNVKQDGEQEDPELRMCDSSQGNGRAPNTWNHVMTQIEKLHGKGFTGSGVKIAIIDTGCRSDVCAATAPPKIFRRAFTRRAAAAAAAAAPESSKNCVQSALINKDINGNKSISQLPGYPKLWTNHHDERDPKDFQWISALTAGGFAPAVRCKIVIQALSTMGNRENRGHWQSMELPEFSTQYVVGQGAPAVPNQPEEPSKKPEEPSKKPEEPAKKPESDDRIVFLGPDNGKKPEQPAKKPESDDRIFFRDQTTARSLQARTELCFPTPSGSKSRNVKADAGKQTEDDCDTFPDKQSSQL
ncbi:subtilisin-like serine protease PR1C [Moelleriella libera RCEF 2490]|uniref:Subtilisin-like serine protease PR1C n=1 Tax=Moelleriella libera RCEF 2490 TaxID=1081109 RepID=A0A167WKK9_9HYPO|nr:subtilisin-like serine protease PR1C [Moelleriella libera RCEF 2490]